MWQYTVSTIPGYFYFRDPGPIEATFNGFGHHTIGLSELIELCRSEWAAKAVIVAMLSAAIFLERRKIFTAKSFCLTIAGGAACLIAAVVLVGLTGKYQEWVLQHRSLAYSGPSYYAYFAMIFLLAAVLLFINQKLGRWKVVSTLYILFVCGGLAIASLATDFYNYYITVDQQLSHLKWRVVDHFLQTEEFKAYPQVRLFTHHPCGGLGALWQIGRPIGLVISAKKKSGKAIQVVENRDEALQRVAQFPGSRLCFLDLEQEPKEPNQYVIFSTLESAASILPSSVYAKDFALFTYSGNKTFKVIGHCAPGNVPIQIAVNNHLLEEEISGNMFVCDVDQRPALDDFPKTAVKSTVMIDVSHNPFLFSGSTNQGFGHPNHLR